MADCIRIGIGLAFWSRISGLSLDLAIELIGRLGMDWLGIGKFAMNWLEIGRLAIDWQISMPRICIRLVE